MSLFYPCSPLDFFPSTPVPYLSPFYYLTLSCFLSWESVMSLLLNPSLCPIFLFSTPDMVRSIALKSWPLAFYISESFSLEIKFYIFSAGIFRAWRYDWNPAGSNRKEIKIGNWCQIKAVNDRPFLDCVDKVNWLGWSVNVVPVVCGLQPQSLFLSVCLFSLSLCDLPGEKRPRQDMSSYLNMYSAWISEVVAKSGLNQRFFWRTESDKRATVWI